MPRMSNRGRTACLAMALSLGALPWGARAADPPPSSPPATPPAAAPGPALATSPAMLAPTVIRPTSGGGYVDRSGFGELIYRSIFEGYLVGSLVGFSLVDANQDPASIARIQLGGVIGAAVGLAVPLLLTHGEVRTGDVGLMGAAQGLGLANGVLIPMIIQLAPCGGLQTPVSGSCTFFNGLDQPRIDSAIGAGLSLAAGTATILIAQQLSLTPGQAETLGSAAIWGALVGFTLADAFTATDLSWSLTMGITLGAADAGAVAAYLLRGFFDMDRSRIFFIDTGVAVGSAVGLALAVFIAPSNTTATGRDIAILAGAAAGWAVGYYATMGLDGFKNNAPPEKTASLGLPTLRPFASLARGERSSGIQIDLVQGRF
ncbi:MAG TPA: hypothetical protein VND93_17090 [Myxococcales bacterium]|nr:hypothetical protein [Myxococcales bacterium]